MIIRVGRIPYLNSEAFYIDMEQRGIELYDFMPSGLAPAMERGEIDAAPLPTVDWFLMEDKVTPVAGFCIATTQKAGSLFLYSKKPIQELTGATIGLTDQSSTTVRLLKVLLALKYQVEPADYVGLRDPNDAFLLIGDDALRRRRGVRGYPHKYDLGQEWYEWTGLPFVFARWVARKDLDPKDLALLEDTLYVGLEDGVDGLYHTNEPRDDLLMLPRDVMEYINGLRFFAGLSDQKAMGLFRQYLEQLNLIPKREQPND